MPMVFTRRQTVLGAGAIIASAGIVSPALPQFWGWWLDIAAGVASNWLYETIKNWGLVPTISIASDVYDAHAESTSKLQQSGYTVEPILSGGYSTGDIKISAASRGNDYLTVDTNSHTVGNRRVCTHEFNKLAGANNYRTATVLSEIGFSPEEVQALAMPMHPPGNYDYRGGLLQSATYMTPGRGTVRWATVPDARPNMKTEIRSPEPEYNFDILHAQADGENWTYHIRKV